MEMNNENKARFFAQYYGQKILCIRSEEQPVLYVGFDDLQNNKVRDSDYLLLKPVSSITDEDAYYVGASVNCWSWAERKEDFFKDDEMKENHIAYGKMFSSAIGKEYGHGLSHPFAHNSTDILHGFDYLRSKGYALPWMGLSDEQMIEAGWIKLTP